jgi:hypothetical protein
MRTRVIAVQDMLRAEGGADPAVFAPGADDEGLESFFRLVGLARIVCADRLLRLGFRFRDACFHHVLAGLSHFERVNENTPHITTPSLRQGFSSWMTTGKSHNGSVPENPLTGFGGSVICEDNEYG